MLLCMAVCCGTFDVFAQGNPKQSREPASGVLSIPDKSKISTFDVQQYLIDLRKGTDSLIFKNKVDLFKDLSPVNEDTASMVWAPTNQLVEISEQILINSIWVTAFEYYASWDTKKINIYDFDPKDFKDSVQIRLFDSFFGSNWNNPLKETKINSEFGFRKYRWHHGTDLKLNTGDPVFNTFDGIVRMKSFDRNGYGYYVLVRHKNGLETLYGHLSKITVEIGQEVRAGDILGLGGSTGRSTGPHLHFEIRYQGLSINPTEIFDFDIGRLKGEVYTITSSSFEHVIQAREAVYHRVRNGQNLSVIARRYGVSINQITRLSNISTRSVLRVGQSLRIR